MKVSIIIPYLHSNLLDRCVDSVKKHSGISEYEIVASEDKERIGCPKMVKRLVEKAASQRVMFLGEDVIVENGFLKEALLAMNKFSDGIGLVALNDNQAVKPTKNRKCKLASHWLSDKRLLPMLNGEFFHTGYIHFYCDNELTERCYEMGRYIFAQKSIIRHKNFKDDIYNEVHHNRKKILYDRNLYNKRRLNKWKTI